MNSFRFLERGIEAELARQRELIEAGGDGGAGDAPLRPRRAATLTPLRSKEEAHDYRYFPEPDLVPLAPTEEMLREARESLPELPEARIRRYAASSASPPTPRRCSPATRRPPPTSSGSTATAEGVEPRVVANWVTGELAAALRQAGDEAARPTRRSSPAPSPRWSTMVQEKKISHGSGKTVLATLVAEGGDPAAIVEREGLAPDRPTAASWRRSSPPRSRPTPRPPSRSAPATSKAIGAIVGAVMRETKGRADGGEVNRLIKEKLGLASRAPSQRGDSCTASVL